MRHSVKKKAPQTDFQNSNWKQLHVDVWQSLPVSGLLLAGSLCSHNCKNKMIFLSAKKKQKIMATVESYNSIPWCPQGGQEPSPTYIIHFFPLGPSSWISQNFRRAKNSPKILWVQLRRKGCGSVLPKINKNVPKITSLISRIYDQTNNWIHEIQLSWLLWLSLK